MRICGKILVLQLISYAQRARERRQTCFFLKFNLSNKLQFLNVQHSFCSVMCYTVLIWTLIWLNFINSILLQSFNWPKPVHYAPADKINASVCICIGIWRTLKLRIHIRRMWILTSFVTSLEYCRFGPQNIVWKQQALPSEVRSRLTLSLENNKTGEMGGECAKNVRLKSVTFVRIRKSYTCAEFFSE